MDVFIRIEFKNMTATIPVNPQTFEVNTAGNNDTVEIINLGEVVIPKRKKLSEISWSSFFPKESWHPAVRTKGQFNSCDFYLEFINNIRDACKPCHLTVSGLGFDEDVVIESFDYYRQAGDEEDVYYTIKFKKYQAHTISVLTIDEDDFKNPQYRLVSTITKPDGTKIKKYGIVYDPTQITVGCYAILNGTVHLDSYGSKPGRTYHDFKCRVNLINKKGTHPYHVTPRGNSNALGWVSKESLVLE